VCRFDFALYLSEQAAERHAEITKNLALDQSGQYLSEKLYLYIDGVEVDSLLISTNLKGQKTTQISIQGSGSGSTQEEAAADARAQMKKLQTILITGSLPYKLEIVKLDSISPSLGKQFTKSLALLGLLVFILVSGAIWIRYKKIKLTLAVMLTMISEALLTLGIAALIRWNLDAPGIAGIIAGIGTGVNDQIVLLDEASHQNEKTTLKERIKRALFIIVGAFLTIVAAMIPLFWAGAGLLRGFALTTILGVSVGILITRPAFAEIIRKIEE
jgi:preprotein translocase subunit SecD